MSASAPLLFHWAPADRIARALLEDRLPGLWRHVLPRRGREVTGLCLGIDPAWWRQDGDGACLVLDSSGIVERDGASWLNSQEIWRFSLDVAPLRGPVRRARLAAAAADPGRLTTPPTELFVEGGLGDVVSATVTVAAIGEAAAHLAPICDRRGLPLARIDAAAARDHDRLAAAMREIVDGLATDSDIAPAT